MKKSLIGTAAALAILLAVPAVAQDAEITVLNLNEPTLVGEKVLQPGTYRLSVMPARSGRQFVRVMSEDGTTLHTTAMTVPHVFEPGEPRPESAMFTFYPAADGQPRVLRTWFAANRPGGIGHDFVYEQDFGTRLAAASSAPVVTYRVADATELDDADVYIVMPDARVETYTWPETTTTVTTTTVTPTPAPVAVAEVRTELPRTAGTTPLVALLGLLSIAGALALRFANR